MCQAFGRKRVEAGRPGRIVNIASMLCFQGGVRVASYTAAKHGITGIKKLLANEWATNGINVNAIAPGYIVSNNTTALRSDKERNAAILDRIPAGRWGEPDDIGGTAVFLLAEASRYLHAATIRSMAVGSHVEVRDEEKGHAMTTKDFTFASGENWIQTRTVIFDVCLPIPTN